MSEHIRPWQSAINDNSMRIGSAAETNNSQKYVDFVLASIETSRVWGVQALKLASEIGRRNTSTTHAPRSTAFLRQRISGDVQTHNACLDCRLTMKTIVIKSIRLSGDFPHIAQFKRTY